MRIRFFFVCATDNKRKCIQKLVNKNRFKRFCLCCMVYSILNGRIEFASNIHKFTYTKHQSCVVSFFREQIKPIIATCACCLFLFFSIFCSFYFKSFPAFVLLLFSFNQVFLFVFFSHFVICSCQV